MFCRALVLCVSIICVYAQIGFNLQAITISGAVDLVKDGEIQTPYDAQDYWVSESVTFGVAETPTFSWWSSNDILQYQSSKFIFTTTGDANSTALAESGSITSTQALLEIPVLCSSDYVLGIAHVFFISDAVNSYQYVLYTSKQCATFDCTAEGCSGNGVCDNGICQCDEGWNGPACDTKLFVPAELCPGEWYNVSWAIPPSKSTPVDWLGFYDLGAAEVDPYGYHYYYYLDGTQTGNRPVPTGNLFVSGLSAKPGMYEIWLFPQNLYVPIATHEMRVKEWAECGFNCSQTACQHGYSSIDTRNINSDGRYDVIRMEGWKRGICDSATGSCGCPPNRYGADCSWGCETESEVFVSGTFIGIENPQKFAVPDKLFCTWRIDLPPNAIGGLVQWNEIDIDDDASRYSQLIVYENDNNNTDSSNNNIVAYLRGVNTTAVSVPLNATKQYYIAFNTSMFQIRGTGFNATIDFFFPRPLKWVKYSDAIAVVFVVLACLGFLMMIISVIIFSLQFYRLRTSVNRMNVWFVLMIFLGIILGYCSIFTAIGKPSKSRCAAMVWIPNLAFTIVFGPLAFKVLNTWWMVRDTLEGKIHSTPTKKLVVFVSVLIFLEIVYDVLWTKIDPLVIVKGRDKSNSSVDYLSCGVKKWWFLGIALIIKALFALLVAAFCIRIRSVFKSYSEARQVTIAVYNIILSLVLFGALIYGLRGFYQLTFIMWSLAAILMSTVTFTVLFYRFFYFLIFNRNVSSTVASTTNNSTENVSQSEN